ncbi:MAG: HPr kinase/phosphatase C-terminal domain-containing protein [Alphaproteobacteria bacterium]|nr:HPr kinase/phosphatase C-terminal domain-containing protein [Rhodospirillales bacterium]MCW9046337.1 HPr kinase/phosphatase C-terminal domain-containing protein [Alphaproteobacteria bacterium]
MKQVHGTCVAIEGKGVLIRGDSGAGKSDLALRLIDGGAILVADDRVVITPDGDSLIASPPDLLAGKLEVRGIGIVTLPYMEAVSIAVVIDLTTPENIDRLPESQTAPIEDALLPLTVLSPFEQSAPQKVRLALQIAQGDIMVTR